MRYPYLFECCLSEMSQLRNEYGEDVVYKCAFLGFSGDIISKTCYVGVWVSFGTTEVSESRNRGKGEEEQERKMGKGFWNI